MVSTQFYISYDYFFKIDHPTSRNTPNESNWQALTGLRKHEYPVRYPNDTAPHRAEWHKSVITRDVQNPPTDDRGGEGFPMEDLPLAEKEIPTYEGDSTHTLLQ